MDTTTTTSIPLLIEAPSLSYKTTSQSIIDLYYAAREGDLATIKLLIESGADVNAAVNEGYVPLHAAKYAKHTHVVEFLLSQGANKNDLNIFNPNCVETFVRWVFRLFLIYALCRTGKGIINLFCSFFKPKKGSSEE